MEEEAAPKRRRISPRTSAAPSSRDATPPTQAEATRPRPRRPSFASPTRASLARYNPGILERRRSSSPAKPSESARASALGAGASASATQPLPDTAAPDVPASEPTGQPSDDDGTTRREGQDAGTAPGRGAFSATGALALPPRQSPNKPNPRPLPPPAPDGEDDLNPFMGRVLRRSPGTGITFPEPREPELPPVTSDPVSSTPPRGIHSSPSRWREKAKQKKPSPLKPHPDRPSKPVPGKSLSRTFAGTRAQASESQPTRNLDPSTSAARQVPAPDPNAAKRKERDALQEKVAKLRKDLELADRENERIRFMQTSGRALGSVDENVLEDVIQRHLMGRDAKADALKMPSKQLLKMALDPKSLMPFSKPGKSIGFVAEDVENWNSIKSHHPIAMSAEQELPYLELFSPFGITSTIAMLPSTPEQPLRQQYSIKLRSKKPSGLFAARIEMVVNAMDLSILELEVPALEPAARFELAPFINKICTGDCNRSMQKNVGLVSWAMGEWCRVATQRGLLWAQLKRELTDKEATVQTTATLRSNASQRGGGEEGEGDTTDPPTSCSRAGLLRFMGQQAFDVDIPASSDKPPTVRLEWKIDFDWTGEAQSRIGVKVGFPGEWHHQDERGALSKIPELFRELVEGGSQPGLAAKTIVALLVGDDV